MRLLTITAILMVLMASAVFASNINIDAPAEMPVYLCAPASYSMTLSNLGDAVVGAGLFSDVDYANYNPQSFWINPGQSQVVSISLDTPCDAKPKTITTTISTTEDEFLYVAQNIITYVPENIQLTTDSLEQTIEACGSLNLNVNLTNPINFTEKYAFTGSGIEFEQPEDAVLSAGESKNVEIPVRISDCTKTGTADFSLTAEALNTHVKATLPYVFSIDSTGVASYKIPSTISFTKPFTKSIDVENLGETPAEYVVRVSANDIASVSPSTLAINASSKSSFDLIFTSPEETSSSLINVTVQNVDTGKKYSQEFEAKYRKPTWIENNWYLALILIIVIIGLGYGIKKSYSYLMSPSMMRKRKIRANERARMIAERLEAKFLARQKKRRAILRASAEARRMRDIKLAQFSWKRPIFFVISLILLAAIGFSLYVFRYAVIPFLLDILESYGVYIFSGVILLIFAVLIIRSASKRKPDIEAKDESQNSKVAEIVNAHTPVSKRSKIVESPKTEVKKKSKFWGFILMLTGLLIVLGAAMQYFPSLNSYRLYAGIAFGILLLLVLLKAYFSRKKKQVSETKQEEPKKKTSKRKIFSAIFIIIALAGLFFVSPRNLNTEGFSGIPDQIIQKNSDAFLDLHPYFVDPDNEELSYSSSGTDKITVDIQEGVARFIPASDFIGEETVLFTAKDSFGAEVNSNQVRLIVKEFAFFERFKTSFSIFLVILFLLGVSLAVFGKNNAESVKQ